MVLKSSWPSPSRSAVTVTTGEADPAHDAACGSISAGAHVFHWLLSAYCAALGSVEPATVFLFPKRPQDNPVAPNARHTNAITIPDRLITLSRPAILGVHPVAFHFVTNRTADPRQLATLLDANQTFTAAPNLRTALRRILELLERQHGMIRSSVTLLNQDTKELHLEAAYGLPVDAQRTRYRVGEGVTGRVVESCKPVIVPQVSKEPLFLNRAARRDLDKDEITFICVPIVLHRKAAGAFSVDLPFEADRDYEGAVGFLRVLASMMAQALKVERLA